MFWVGFQGVFFFYSGGVFLMMIEEEEEQVGLRLFVVDCLWFFYRWEKRRIDVFVVGECCLVVNVEVVFFW